MNSPKCRECCEPFARERQRGRVHGHGVRVDRPTPVGGSLTGLGGPFLALKGDAVSKTFKRIATAAGIAGCSFHDLRRTCCKNLLDAGVPPTTVQRILGHYDINTTLTYYNSVDKEDFAAAMARMDRAATGSGHNVGMKEAAS